MAAARGLRLGQQLFEHIGQDPARREVRGFDGRVDPEYEGHGLAPAVLALDVQDCPLARAQRRTQLQIESRRPVCFRYSLTTREPGASEVLTQGSTLSPRATAFFASKPAASMTAGLEVLVHEVMAAMTTPPLDTSQVNGLAGGALAWTSRLGVGRLFIISISVSVFVFCAPPLGAVWADWSPPPGQATAASPSRTFTRRAASTADLP